MKLEQKQSRERCLVDKVIDVDRFGVEMLLEEMCMRGGAC